MFTETIDILFIFAVLAPIVFWIGTKVNFKKLVDLWATLGFILSLYWLYSIYEIIKIKEIMVITIAKGLLPISWTFEIDALGVFMASIFVFIGLLTSIYSIRYMERDTGLAEYYILLLLMVAGMVGVVFAGDFFTFFIFWEIMCITSYVLVAFRKEEWEPVEAGFKYLIMSSTGSVMVLFAMSILYGMTGTLNFAYLASSLSNGATNLWSVLALALVVIGFGIKASIVPMHSWLPDAHPAAPSSISAMLSGVVIKAGAYALMRSLLIIFIPEAYNWQIIVAILAVLTMSVGNLMALLQKDLKRLLAFSSIAQMGYIIFGLSIATFFGLTGGIFHVMNHAIMKSLLFLCSGAFLYAVESRNLDDLAGIGRKMKLTGVMFTIGSLALAGVPPLNGFQSEYMILFAGIDIGGMNGIWYIFSAIMLLNILFSVGYYLRLIQILMLKEPTKVSRKAKEAPLAMLLPMGILAVLCIVIGVYPGPFVSYSSTAAKAVLDVGQYVTAIIR
jgi:proton-translocating NADH-quinone oxidoreductase chain M